MEKNDITFNALLIINTLLNVIYTQSMEHNNYAEQALQIEECTQHINLFKKILELPDNFFTHILQNHENDSCRYDEAQLKRLKNRIKYCMGFKATCKLLYRLLTAETIGSLCQHYDLEVKNKALQQLACRDLFTKKGRLPALILICAGAQDNDIMLYGKEDWHRNPCFYRAALCNDEEYIRTLLKHGANPNVKLPEHPMIFYIRKIEITRLFIEHGANLNIQNRDKGNVLWHIIGRDEYSSELMELYLNNNVDARVCVYGKCLLHGIAEQAGWPRKNSDDLLKKAKLLLKIIPDMINTDYNKETPLDILQKGLNNRFGNGKTDEITGELIWYTIPKVTETINECIALFKEHGALTAEELNQQSALISQNQCQEKSS